MKNHIIPLFFRPFIRLSLCWAVCAVVGSVEAFAQEELLRDIGGDPNVTVEKTPNENAEKLAMDPVEKEKISTSENPKYKDWELTYLFGTPEPTGNDLTATFYCMKRPGGMVKNDELKTYFSTMKEFVEGGWDTSVFDDFSHSPSNLYAQCIAIPRLSRPMVPFSFGLTDYSKYDSCWAVHYQGKIMHKDGITFRFWGAAETLMNVGIDKKVVLAANHPWPVIDSYRIAADFFNGALPKESRQSENDYGGDYSIWGWTMVGSEWITLDPGEEYDFDAVVGGGFSGSFFAMLMVEVLGERYEENDRDGKIFPLFATQPLSMEVQDSILMSMNSGDCNVTNITSYFMEKRADNDQLMQAQLDELPEEDRPHVAIKNAPRLKVMVRGSEHTAEYQPNSWEPIIDNELTNAPINITQATFGASVTQLDTDQVYDCDLDVEIYVLTKQCYAPTNFHLISHAQSESFRLNEENQFRYVFAEKKKHTFFSYQINVDGQKRDCGEALAEYLVLVRNESDEVVGHAASSAWLYENLARLEKLPVGAWINDECIRIHPTTPEWVEEEDDQSLKSVQR